MRVLVLAEAIGDLRAGTVGAAVARAWAARGHDVALVPLAAAGGGLSAAVEDVAGAHSGIVVIESAAAGDSSSGVGDDILAALGTEPDQIWVDLAACEATDAGEGLLRVLASASAVSTEAVGEARHRLGRTRLVGVVPIAQVSAELTGMRGVASLAAAAARDAGKAVPSVAELLEQDGRFAAAAAAMGLPQPPKGAGAAGGVALAVLAVGGTIASSCGAIAEVARLGRTVEQADLIVVVADALDFGDAGGEVVSAARTWAEAASRPCVALGETVRISARELRTLGIEAAYGLSAGEAATEASLGALAERVAATWSWGRGNGAAGESVYPHVH